MRGNKGFTLIELIVVTIILATLAAFSMPQLLKTVETSRAHDALGMLNSVATGVRMFKTDWPNGTLSPTGPITTAMNATACPANGKPTTVNELLGCKYVSPHDWDNLRYQFYVCEGGAPAGTCCVAGAVACADRRDTVDGVPTKDEFKSWSYYIDNIGGCVAGTAGTSPTPPCPGV